MTGYGILDARGVLLASREHPEQALWAAREIFSDRVAWVVRLSDDAVLAFHQRAPGKRPATVRHQVAEVQSEQLATLERPLLPRPAPAAPTTATTATASDEPACDSAAEASAATTATTATATAPAPPAPVVELVEPSPEERLLAALGPELLTTDELAARTGLDRDRARTGLLALWSDGLVRWERACWAVLP